jgi:DNA-binding transcriptional MocR family regulator
MMWRPSLTGRDGPLYRQILEALRDDIESGLLDPGQRLPTHRELANALDITPGTIARAYGEAQELGIITSGVGRGTFVAAQLPRPIAKTRHARNPRGEDRTDPIDLASNYIAAPRHRSFFRESFGQVIQSELFDAEMSYPPHGGHPEHRETGARWIGSTTELHPDPSSVVVCNGGQHALVVALRATARPADKLLVEELTYPGVKAAASFLNLELVPVRMDHEGIDPDALQRAAANSQAKVLYLMPTLHNPTTRSLGPERRAAVARVAERLQLRIIEDGVYDFLPHEPQIPIASMLPTQTLYFNSLAKSVSPGLQIGFLVVPPKFIEPVRAALRATSWSASALPAALASRAIRSGKALEMMRRNRTEAARRQAIARSIFRPEAGARYFGPPTSYHAWLELPNPCRSASFVAAARAKGAAVLPADAFVATGACAPPNAVRISLVAPRGEEETRGALEILDALLHQQTDPYISVV